MHEYSAANNLVDLVLKECNKNNIQGKNKVKVISVVIGKLNWIYPEIFNDCFHIISQNSILENSSLKIIGKPAQIKCRNCNEITEIIEPIFICKNCLSCEVDIVSGQEFYLESIEVDD